MGGAQVAHSNRRASPLFVLPTSRPFSACLPTHRLARIGTAGISRRHCNVLGHLTSTVFGRS